jgi:peptidyl-prolyl cis-trans isomerase D
MIQSLTHAIKNSILLKIFLGVMTVSFGIWGIGDFLTPGMDPSIAVTVGNTDISATELQRDFSNQLDQLRQSMGGHAIDSPELKRSVLATTLDRLTRSTTADVAAHDMGIVVTQDRLRDEIRHEKMFQDPNGGGFNQMLYARILASNQLTEKQYLSLITADIRRNTLMQPIAESAAAPTTLVSALTSYRGETRTADTLLISAADMDAPAAPSDDALKAVYDKNIASFTAPEYRKVTAVVIRATDLVQPDSFTEDQVKAYYNDNISRYRDPESRVVSQLIFTTKEQADAAYALAAPGDHLADVAKKAKLDPPVDLEPMTHDSPLAKMIGAAYDTPVGTITQPVHTDLGWHLFEVKSITPEKTVPFESVVGQIRTAMAEDKGTDALYDASTQLDDGVASGTPLDELAKRVGGHLVQIDAVDQQGHDPQGKEPAGLIDNKRFVDTAFATPVGGTSKLMEIPKGYYVLTVNAITPPKPKPLADVRKDVTELWEKETRTAAAHALATKLAKDAGPSTPLADLAPKTKGVSFAPLGPLTRFGEGLNAAHMIDSKRVSPELLEKLFTAKPGDVITANVANGTVVARLRDIIPPGDGEDTAKLRAQVANAVKEGIAQDLLAETSQALSERYPAKVNQKVIDHMAAGSSAASD